MGFGVPHFSPESIRCNGLWPPKGFWSATKFSENSTRNPLQYSTAEIRREKRCEKRREKKKWKILVAKQSLKNSLKNPQKKSRKNPRTNSRGHPRQKSTAKFHGQSHRKSKDESTKKPTEESTKASLITSILSCAGGDLALGVVGSPGAFGFGGAWSPPCGVAVYGLPSKKVQYPGQNSIFKPERIVSQTEKVTGLRAVGRVSKFLCSCRVGKEKPDSSSLSNVSITRKPIRLKKRPKNPPGSSGW